MTDYEPHPLSQLFPMMESDEFEKFKADIQANGLHDQIMIYEGKILDGRNRYRALKELGRQIEVRFWPGFGSSPTAYVLGKNLNRRHLSSSQRAAIAVEALPYFEAEAKVRESAGRPKEGVARLPQDNAKSRDHAAKSTGSSPRYVQDAKKLKDVAPEQYEQVKQGKKTIPQAKRDAGLTKKTNDAFQVLIRFKQLWKTLGEEERALIREYILAEGA